ncbi:MAG TPA: PAS domain-containing protein, partial [Methylophaga aminisulfidivorans]|nr:PAS domain-containing protein [Methylophaga aminisulfidivorans]
MESEEFLLVADKLPQGIILLTKEGLILAVNKKASQLLQILPKNLVNKNISSISAASKKTVIELLRPCSRTRSPVTLSLKLLNNSCTITTGFLFTPASDSMSATVLLTIQKGRPSSTQFLALNQEIYKQKNLMRLLMQSRDNLEEALEKLQLAASVFSHAREAIVITDASNKIHETNNTYTEITGYTN